MNKVSVIITCFNKEPYLTECLNSVLASTYKNLEIICFNDASKDGSINVLRDFENKYQQVSVIDSATNHGVIYGRNYSIEKCTGDYILPLDADDLIAPTYIEKAVKILQSSEKIGVVYCKAQELSSELKNSKLDPFDRDRMLFKNVVSNCALFRKSDFIAVGQ